MKLLSIFVGLTVIYSVYCGATACTGESGSINALEVKYGNCDVMKTCQINCQFGFYPDISCPARIEKGQWVPYTIDIDAETLGEAYRVACITHSSEKKVDKLIMDYNYKNLVQLEDMSTYPLSESNQLFKKVLENPEFKSFWKNFKKKCTAMIGGKNQLQRATDTFLSYQWKDQSLKNAIHTLYEDKKTRQNNFVLMINELLAFSSGKLTHKCQCTSIKTLIETGVAPDGSKHNFFQLKPKIQNWITQIKETCLQQYTDCVVPPNWKGFWIKVLDVNQYVENALQIAITEIKSKISQGLAEEEEFQQLLQQAEQNIFNQARQKLGQQVQGVIKFEQALQGVEQAGFTFLNQARENLLKRFQAMQLARDNAFNQARQKINQEVQQATSYQQQLQQERINAFNQARNIALNQARENYQRFQAEQQAIQQARNNAQQNLANIWANFRRGRF